MELKEILTKIQQTRIMAERDVENVPAQTRTGIITAVNEAKEDLRKLKVTYGNEFFKNVRGVFVTGDKQKALEFAKLPEKEGESITVDVEALYTRIAKEVESSLGNSTHRALKSEHVNIMVSVLREIGQELNLIDMPMLRIKSYDSLPTYQDVVSFVRDTIRATVGDDLNKDYFVQKTVAKAIDTGYCKPTTNLVLVNASPDEVDSLGSFLTAGVSYVTVESDAKVTPAYVAAKLGTKVAEEVNNNKTNKKNKQ